MGDSVPPVSRGRHDRQPDRWLPIYYFTFAHLCLGAAFGVVLIDPLAVAGFYYHSRLIALVHLVTLGWISGSILGALYMISPMALRTPLPARKIDRVAFWIFAIGTLGMASHFWIDEPWGMISAAALVWFAVLLVGSRFLARLARSTLPAEVQLLFFLAFFNVLLAGALGLGIGVDKSLDVIEGFTLHHVVAHAHLAALGWATMMVMAAGYRLIPMILPAAVPLGLWVWGTAVAMEIGVLGLAATLFTGSRWRAIFSCVTAAGIAMFVSRVVWMVRHPKPAPKALRRPDFGVLHVAYALVCLLLAVALGLILAWAPDARWKLEAAMIYGCLGLLVFLAQMVVGVAARFVPLYGWFRSFAGSDFQTRRPSPHDTPHRPTQLFGFLMWLVGLPLLTAGLAYAQEAAARVGAGCLLAAVVTSLVHQAAVLRRADAITGEAPTATLH